MMGMIEALRKVIKRMHYPLEVMLICVRWYVSLRQTCMN
jgi:putative transposase